MAEARALARLYAETVIVAKGLVNVPGTLDILRESDAARSIRAIANIIGIERRERAAGRRGARSSFYNARCHRAALWSHFEGGIKAPSEGRRNGATSRAA